jgi:hypothetical protein
LVSCIIKLLVQHARARKEDVQFVYFTRTGGCIMNNLNLSTYLKVIAAGKMKAMQTAAVAPVNWKASQMLGMKFADTKITRRSTAVITPNLVLSEDRGLAEENRSPSKLSRSAWNIMGNTSIRWTA